MEYVTIQLRQSYPNFNQSRRVYWNFPETN